MIKHRGLSGVPNWFLKLLGEALVETLRVLIQGCLEWEYYPRAFKIARTVVLKKPGKPDYQQPKAWRPTALLETTGKVIEAVIARLVRRVAEENGPLPDQQMGAREGRSTEFALALLLSQIRSLWEGAGSLSALARRLGGLR